jgi:hypothetical protein
MDCKGFAFAGVEGQRPSPCYSLPPSLPRAALRPLAISAKPGVPAMRGRGKSTATSAERRPGRG